MKQQYIKKRFSKQSQRLIVVINRILDAYAARNLDLTLRQLYYQLVATAYDEIPDEWANSVTGSKNNENAYDNIGKLVGNARLAGLIDWDMLSDRGRVADRVATWDSVGDRLLWASKTHRLDKWADQPNSLWVMVEKQALEGAIVPVCRRLEVPFIANKGYSSLSSMREIGRELLGMREIGKDIHVIYLGDHDPSGINMTDDIQKRLEMFSEGDVEVHRIALNMNQVRLYNPPPNPAKQTDSRYDAYCELYGEECWELDALTVDQLQTLVRDSILGLRDDDTWEESVEVQEFQRRQLMDLTDRVINGKVELLDEEI
jgi:hypothetical protein